MPSLEPVMEVYARLYPALADWGRPFRRLAAVRDIRNGDSPKDAGKRWGISGSHLSHFLAGDPIAAMFGATWDEAAGHPENRKARRGIGQMMLGSVAETAFERLFTREVGSTALVLKDLRDARNDTDYHVVDESGRPVFRANIKAHGTLFRNAPGLVGLEPENCFALATYKIYQGLIKEQEERLPYVFMVATVPDLTGESIGNSVPDDLARFATLLRVSKGVSELGKRGLEERIVSFLLESEAPYAFAEVRDQVLARLENADWRALSADKANRLLRDLLFDRVYAVKVRGFAQNYPNAELDMHFALREDMTPLGELIRIYKEDGLHKLTSLLSRGDI